MSEALASRNARIADLEAKLKVRKGKAPYRDNVPLIEAELVRLKSALEEEGNPADSEKDQNNG